MSTSRPPPSSDSSTALSSTPAAQDTPSTRATPPSPKSCSRKRKCRIHRPAENSLYDLIHEHAGTSLFVRPICWTDLHAKVLGAQFLELPPCDTPLPINVAGSPPSKGHLRPSHAIRTLSEALTTLMTPSPQHPMLLSNSVRTILSTLWPDAVGKPHFLPELHMYFGGRVYREVVRAQIMWNFASGNESSQLSSSFRSVSTRPVTSFDASSASSSQAFRPVDMPMLCYIGKNQLASIRKNLFRVVSGPGRSWNEPVHRLQQLRAKALMPSNPDQDAHFIGLFLAMAQRHFYGVPQPSSRRNSQWSPLEGPALCPEFRDVKMRILTHDAETSELLVYTGHVTANFLRFFREPFNIPKEGNGDFKVPSIKIEYTRVPVWPILGLRERLGKALGHDIVGSFDPEKIETWEDEPAETVGEGTGKRKREALAEVFNGSFDETSSNADEPALGGKKRCLSEGSPVGVVV